MIAAIEPQEFIPGGRQQALRHPGPTEPAQRLCGNIGSDDLLLHQFQKVSIAEPQATDWWRIRKVSNYPSTEPDTHHFKCKADNVLPINKTFSSMLSNNKSHSELLCEDSWNLKVETVKNTTQRLSDGGAKLHQKLKRFSNETLQPKVLNESTGDVSRQYNVKLKSSCDYVEEELYVKGNLVVWSEGLSYNNEEQARNIICCYSSPCNVIDAVWCSFQCEDLQMFGSGDQALKGERISCVCIADSQNLRFYTRDQDDFISSLPFTVRKLWSCKLGILIERANDKSEMQDLEISANVFSISHPLDIVRPLSSSKLGVVKLLDNRNVEIVFTSDTLNICMVYDANLKQHSICQLRKLTRDETEAYRLNNSKTQSMSTSKYKSFASLRETNGKNCFPSFLSRPSSATISSANQRSGPLLKNQSPLLVNANSLSQTPISSPLIATANNSNTPRLMKSSRLCTSMRFNMSVASETANVNENQYLSEPQLCLESVWTESVPEDVVNCASSNVFLTDDLTGQWFFCYLVNSRSQLCLLKFDYLNNNRNNKMVFGMVTTLSAKDAISLPHLHMLAILEHSGNVVLYSGLTSVGKLHIGGALTSYLPSPYTRRRSVKEFQSPFPRRSSLLPHCGTASADVRFDEHLLSPVLPSIPGKHPILHIPEACGESSKVILCGLKDPIENKLTLQYSDGSYYRVSLPFMAQSNLIESCLNALRISLPKECCMNLLCRWYSVRNAPGTQEMLVEEEWKLFVRLLMELLGFEAKDSSESNATPYCQVKRLKSNLEGSDSDWLRLVKANTEPIKCLNTILNFSRSESVAPEKHADGCMKMGPLYAHISVIHYILHLVYEDLKLNIFRKEELRLLAKFLSHLAQILRMDQYMIHYWKDFPDLCPVPPTKTTTTLTNESEIIKWPSIPLKPTSIFEHLQLLSSNVDEDQIEPYPIINHINSRSRDIVQLCRTYLTKKGQYCINKMVNVIVPPSSRNKTSDVQTPARGNPKESLTSETSAQKVVLLLVDMKIDTRELETYPLCVNFIIYDALWTCRQNPPSDWGADAYHLLRRSDLALQASVTIDSDNGANEGSKVELFSTVNELLPSISQNRDGIFTDGMEEIEGSNLLKLRFSSDQRVAEVRRLLQSSRPVPVVLTQRPDTSDHYFIEEQERHLFAICARTMALPVGRGMFTLRTSTPVITEVLPIPPLCLTGKAPPRGATVELTHIDTPMNMNQWPLFHNGVANGLRIDSTAKSIDSTWIVFNKPKTNAETLMEHAGFLMALGLNGHLQNLAIYSTYDYLAKLHEITSVGVLLGLAAVFRGTPNAAITRMLSVHIEALLPPTSMELDVPQNLQVAALLGVGLVYQGTAHRHMTEVLLSEIGRPPGPEMENSVDRQSYSLSAGLGLGLVTLRQGGKPSGLADLNVSDTLHYYMVGGSKRPLLGSQKDKYKVPSFQIREGACVNLDVTAPGATLALGLMYLATGNKAVADWMAPPVTQYMLDFVRPDFLMLRTLSRALILWNGIEAEKDWIEEQVPSTIRPYCMVEPNPHIDLDYEAMNQAYCNIIAGACFAMGLKYAGSADPDAFEVLLQYCHMFTSLTSKSIAELAGKPTIETCLNVVLLAAAMVMAGTGNLEIMRIVRYLRRRVGLASSAVVTYGSHLALHMALGLLFLGGGRYTLSNSPASVAALICAFYPKFPTHSNDNRYHLQAFRHLYVLAVQPRLIIPKDINSGKMCYANINVVKLDGTTIDIKGPSLIPDANSLYKVSISDDRYLRVVFERERNWGQLLKILSSCCCVDVKQKAGCLSYMEDKEGFKSEIAKTLTQSKVIPWDPLAKSIVNFSSDPIVKHFVDHFLTPAAKEAESLNESERKQQQNLVRVTYDCVIQDKIFCCLPLFNQLLQIVKNIYTSTSTLELMNLQVVTTFATNSQNKNSCNAVWLLALHQEALSCLDNWEPELKQLLKHFIEGNKAELSRANNENMAKLCKLISFYNIPYALDFGADAKKRQQLLHVACLLQKLHCNSETVDIVLKILNFVR